MKFVDSFRDAGQAHRTANAIRRLVTRPWRIMEICGGQTHAILRHGLDELLPPEITLLHGPGCPVCVTPAETIDLAIAIARRPGVVLCSFGDMMRVPGDDGSLLAARARGADARMVYSPLDALRLARETPERQVVFFAVGFETTAPAVAMAAALAKRDGVRNFSLLIAHVLVPPAMEALLGDPSVAPQGFLAAGHVCAVMGYHAYEPIAARHRVPIVVTGFEPLDILLGLHGCIGQLERGEARVENHYRRSVRPEGNETARTLLRQVFDIVPRAWRGMGEIPASGLALRDAYRDLDARRRFGEEARQSAKPNECRSGDILRGAIKPAACPSFGTGCTPDHPLGPTMVSSEGACAAYYQHRRSDAHVVAP